MFEASYNLVIDEDGDGIPDELQGHKKKKKNQYDVDDLHKLAQPMLTGKYGDDIEIKRMHEEQDGKRKDSNSGGMALSKPRRGAKDVDSSKEEKQETKEDHKARAEKKKQEQKARALEDFEQALKRGVCPHRWNGPSTPLLTFLRAKQDDVVDVLLRSGASVAEVDAKGVSVLHVAVFQGNLPMCQRIIDAQADVNCYDKQLQTPLFFAPSSIVCSFLLHQLADLTIINRKGQTALHLAGVSGNEAVLFWFINHLSREMIELKDRHGAPATYYARQSGVKHPVIHSMYNDEAGVCMHFKQLKEMRPHRPGEKFVEELKTKVVGHIVKKSEEFPGASPRLASPRLSLGPRWADQAHSDKKRLSAGGHRAPRSSVMVSGRGRGRGRGGGRGRGSTPSSGVRSIPEVYALSDASGLSPGGRSPYGWEASDTPASTPGGVPQPSQGKSVSRQTTKDSSCPVNASIFAREVEKERVIITRQMELSLQREKLQMEKEKKDIHHEIEATKRQIGDMNAMREQAKKSEKMQKEIEKMRKENEEMRAAAQPKCGSSPRKMSAQFGGDLTIKID